MGLHQNLYTDRPGSFSLAPTNDCSSQLCAESSAQRSGPRILSSAGNQRRLFCSEATITIPSFLTDVSVPSASERRVGAFYLTVPVMDTPAYMSDTLQDDFYDSDITLDGWSDADELESALTLDVSQELNLSTFGVSISCAYGTPFPLKTIQNLVYLWIVFEPVLERITSLWAVKPCRNPHAHLACQRYHPLRPPHCTGQSNAMRKHNGTCSVRNMIFGKIENPPMPPLYSLGEGEEDRLSALVHLFEPQSRVLSLRDLDRQGKTPTLHFRQYLADDPARWDMDLFARVCGALVHLAHDGEVLHDTDEDDGRRRTFFRTSDGRAVVTESGDALKQLSSDTLVGLLGIAGEEREYFRMLFADLAREERDGKTAAASMGRRDSGVAWS